MNPFLDRVVGRLLAVVVSAVPRKRRDVKSALPSSTQMAVNIHRRRMITL